MTVIPLARPALDQDILCIRCGYNLRGLDAQSNCPECGLNIADSTRGDRLLFADPQWLKKVRFGATLKLWNLLIGILIGGGTGLIVGFGGPFVLAFFAAVLGALLGLWATFAITTQEPRITLTEDPVTLRKVIRICAVLLLMGVVAQQVSGASGFGGGRVVTAPPAIWLIVGLIVGIAGLVVTIGELKYFRQFAVRAPDPQLARSTRILMWGMGVTYGLVIMGGVVLAAMAPAITAAMAVPAGTTTTTSTSGGVQATMTTTATIAPAGGPPTPLNAAPTAAIMAGSCIFSVAAFVFMLWYVVLLFRYRKLLHHATELALQGGDASQSPTLSS